MAVSQYLTILEQMQARIQGLTLLYQGKPVPVAIKKIALWLAGIALPPLPIVLISLDDKPESITPFSSEDEVLVKYNTAVISLVASNRDNTANMDMLLSWREQERKLFQWGLQPNLSNVFFAEVVPDPPLLRDAAFKNYDASGFGIRLWNVEPRTSAIASV